MRTVEITENVNLCFSHATIGAVTRRIHDLKPQLKVEMSANVGSWEWLIASSFVESRAYIPRMILANIGGGMFEVGLATPTILCRYV